MLVGMTRVIAAAGLTAAVLALTAFAPAGPVTGSSPAARPETPARALRGPFGTWSEMVHRSWCGGGRPGLWSTASPCTSRDHVPVWFRLRRNVGDVVPCHPGPHVSDNVKPSGNGSDG